MILRSRAPDAIFENYSLALHISHEDADKVTVFQKHASGYQHVLGGDTEYYEVRCVGEEETTFYVGSLSQMCISQDWFPSILPCRKRMMSLPDNSLFLEEVNSFVKKAKCKLTICSLMDSRGDRWIQGPDFGYVTREPEDPFDVSTLDSFGNLEVCPPVTVDGKEYPLGRILIGGHCPTSGCLQMTKVVRDFLHAQQVQKPLELWSDWLHVAHVDEFLTFVPAPDRLKVKTFTINQILSNKNLEKESKHVQSCIDLNRALLKEELGLVEEDLIDIPALFKLGNSGLASAFFPDMVSKNLGLEECEIRWIRCSLSTSIAKYTSVPPDKGRERKTDKELDQ
ncbi:hypothetical protein NDU88_010516 [Pleurodeles waltl]|uniref:Uncharacterized protein n=1 Tax=Pleurodeles waltl TaxID=8319 RepID=A0AAV7R0T2_PLEWA|nr:hypothetical protein NDU88_010516 [Pleurodeles waltl]